MLREHANRAGQAGLRGKPGIELAALLELIEPAERRDDPLPGASALPAVLDDLEVSTGTRSLGAENMVPSKARHHENSREFHKTDKSFRHDVAPRFPLDDESRPMAQRLTSSRAKGMESLPLYPEGRACRRPTASKVIDLYEDVRRHSLSDVRNVGSYDSTYSQSCLKIGITTTFARRIADAHMMDSVYVTERI